MAFHAFGPKPRRGVMLRQASLAFGIAILGGLLLCSNGCSKQSQPERIASESPAIHQAAPQPPSSQAAASTSDAQAPIGTAPSINPANAPSTNPAQSQSAAPGSATNVARAEPPSASPGSDTHVAPAQPPSDSSGSVTNAAPAKPLTVAPSSSPKVATARTQPADAATPLRERTTGRPQPALPPDEQETVDLFTSAGPSVVHITTHALERDFFSMNTTEVPQGTGTGIVWDTQGHVITNYHVIEDADGAHVAMADHSTWPAELVGVAPEKDLALLKIDAPAAKLHPLRLGDSKTLQVGQKSLAIGNPFGLDQTLTTGIVSALGRELQTPDGRVVKNVIQTDAAINPGNSGGPLLDSSGRLIGITTAIYSPSGAYAGIGFAIPVETVAWVVPELIAHGKIIRPTLAISVAPDNWTDKPNQGVLVLGVKPGSSAEKAGLRPTRRDSTGHVYLGDIITSLEDAPIESTNDLLTAFEHYKAGDVVALGVDRGGQHLTLKVPLEAS